MAEVFNVEQLGGVVLGGCDDRGHFFVVLEVVDVSSVLPDRFQFLARLGIPLLHRAVFVSSNDSFVNRAPHSRCDLKERKKAESWLGSSPGTVASYICGASAHDDVSGGSLKRALAPAPVGARTGQDACT